MKKFFLLFAVLFIGFFGSSIWAQSVKDLALQALDAKEQDDRLAAAQQLQTVLMDSLTTGSFQLPASKITNLSIQSSSDGFLRFFTWCVPMNQGFYEYFGILQILSEKPKIFSLYDDIIDDDDEQFLILDTSHWCGAVYSKIITTTYKKQTYYTLLGWDGNNALSEIKIIDILTFNENKEPIFGKQIFENCNHCKRIFLEYKKDAVCNLRYEKQTGKYNGKKIVSNMIVFEKLAPLSPYFEGVRSMYIPTDIFDAFFWKDGMWHFLENIDARNY